MGIQLPCNSMPKITSFLAQIWQLTFSRQRAINGTKCAVDFVKCAVDLLRRAIDIFKCAFDH